MASAARSTGVVLWFNHLKGYGFIKSDEGDNEFFVHRSSITSADSDGVRFLNEKDAVEFSVQVGGEDKGNKTMAVDVAVTARNTAPRNNHRSEIVRRTNGEVRNCYTCRKPGHMAKDCRSNTSGNGVGAGAVVNCYNCGKPGHFSRNCTAERGGGGGRACYNCGVFGHLARDCTQGNGGGESGCHNCGEFGHVAMDCRYQDGGFRYVGKSGGERRCYTCDGYGHFARDCTGQGNGGGSNGGGGVVDGGKSGGGGAVSRVQVVCFNCNKQGHRQRVCPHPKKPSS